MKWRPEGWKTVEIPLDNSRYSTTKAKLWTLLQFYILKPEAHTSRQRGVKC